MQSDEVTGLFARLAREVVVASTISVPRKPNKTMQFIRAR
jgi:hypothetical protein